MNFLFDNPKLRCRDVAKVERKLKRIIEDGIDRLMVISDFDYTLSRYHVQGEKCVTTHGVFETASSLTCAELGQKCELLKAQYLPIEYDPRVPVAEKTPLMEVWWRTAHKYIIEAKLTNTVLEHCVENAKIELREEADVLLTNLHAYGIPLIIFSAGIGNVIEIFLKNRLGRITENTHIISNMMKFDADGYVAQFVEPLIHTFCKNASVIQREHVFFQTITNRPNVILMGDSLGDLDMNVGVDGDGAVLKIGFLNFNFDSLLDEYLDGYDIVLIDDQSMDVPRHILRLVYSPLEAQLESAYHRKISTCRVEAADEEHPVIVEEDEEAVYATTKVMA